MATDFSTIMSMLEKASGFDLFRLNAAIERTLADPKWIAAVRAQLRAGQQIQFFDSRANALASAQILEFRRKEVLVRRLDNDERWLIIYTAINLGGADVSIRDNPIKGLGRQAVTVGETVGFIDHEQRQRSGQIVRLNDKTVTLLSSGQKWRVAYSHLHRVVDTSGDVIDGQLTLDSYSG